MRTTYEVPAEGIVDLREAAAERVQLRARLAALLELALEAAEDVVEREAALARHADVPAHAAHPDEALRLERRPALRRLPVRAALAVPEVEGAVARAGLVRHRADEARALLLRLRLGALRGLRVELGEHAHDSCCDLVVDDRLVVFTDDVDAEFLEGTEGHKRG